MTELKGLSVAEKRFEFTLPVSGQKMFMKYATRKDKKNAFEYSGTGNDQEERYELCYMANIVEPENKSLSNAKDPTAAISSLNKEAYIEWLRDLTEKDFNMLRIMNDRVNNISPAEMSVYVRDFAIAQK